ncbi:MAG: hypothetical protein L6461_03990, partial [Anaerolineae bacterium]|nr:hypothetical protein [Anaerolineae bacterium]
RVFELTTWLKRYQNGLFSPHLMYRIKSSTGKKKSWYEKSKLFFRHSLPIPGLSPDEYAKRIWLM